MYLHLPLLTVTSPPPLYADRRGAYYEVEAILGKQRRGRKSWHYLVKWAGYDDSENSWEDYAACSPS
jgi:hypothetical protein